MRHFQKDRVKKFRKYLKNTGIDSLEAEQALAYNYRLERLEYQAGISGIGELPVIICSSLMTIGPLLLDSEQISSALSNEVFSWIIMILIYMPLIVYGLRKICNAYKWPDTKEYILSDLEEIIKEDIQVRKKCIGRKE